MRLRLTILTCLIAVLQIAGYGQTPDNCILIEGEDVVLYLDQRWTRQEQINAIDQFDMKDLSLDSLWRFHSIGKYSREGWKVKIVNKDAVKIFKSINDLTGKLGQGDETYAFNDLQLSIDYQTRATFGYNDFRRPVVTKVKSGKTRFFLAGYNNASRVYLSGTFNEWSTRQTKMLKVDSGWISDIYLNPGKHVYKYIIDGRWRYDPNNYNTEDDYNGGLNSVYYECNHEFRLKGYQSARSVVLTGTFNDWNERRAKMSKTRNGWLLPVYLKDGTYAYKFKVDRDWITDPSNPKKRDDGGGNINSVISIGDPVKFSLSGYMNAREVFVAGSFNNWNNRELKMTRTHTGWELDYVLSAGDYEYKFIVDGRWVLDPKNPHTSGDGDAINSMIAVKPNQTFLLKGYNNAREVRISGNFNDWSQKGYTLKKVNNGWIIELNLPRGKCLYKFVVDGQWILDPGNKLWEQNEFGTGNSVLWVDSNK